MFTGSIIRSVQRKLDWAWPRCRSALVLVRNCYEHHLCMFHFLSCIEVFQSPFSSTFNFSFLSTHLDIAVHLSLLIRLHITYPYSKRQRFKMSQICKFLSFCAFAFRLGFEKTGTKRRSNMTTTRTPEDAIGNGDKEMAKDERDFSTICVIFKARTRKTLKIFISMNLKHLLCLQAVAFFSWLAFFSLQIWRTQPEYIFLSTFFSKFFHRIDTQNRWIQ